MAPHTDEIIIHNLLNKGVTDCIERKSIEEKLQSGKQLRIKFGVDPTGNFLHIGHAVPMLKLAEFQKLGHQVVVLIGNATAQVGDSTDRESERPMLTREETEANARSYLESYAKVLDLDKVEIVYNADWLDKVSFCEVGEIAKNFSVAQMLDRDNFSKRYKEGKRISLQEFLYPLMQGYDSVALKADIEIGGNDQYFNLMAGRPIQDAYGQPKQDILTFELIEGTDGRKMSKSYHNFVALDSSANEKFVKLMEINDDLIIRYFENCTTLYLDEIEAYQKRLDNGEHPREVKKELAHMITSLWHGKDEADSAQAYFEQAISKGGRPNDKDIEIVGVGVSEMPLVSLIRQIGMVNNSTEARNAVSSGGVEINEEKVSDLKCVVKLSENEKILIKVGKKKFKYVILER